MGPPEILDMEKRGELLEWLYRPLDRQDMPWMMELGYDWPVDDAQVEVRLTEANRLIDIGSERQGSHPDLNSEVVYDARKAFFELLPVADTASEAFSKSRIAREGRKGQVPALDSFVGSRRLLQRIGTDQKNAAINYAALSASPEIILAGAEALAAHGLDPNRVMKYGSAVGSRAEAITIKIQAMYGIARTWGWDRATYQEDVNRIIEAWPYILGRSSGHIFTLGRLSTLLFDQESPATAVSDVSGVVRTPLERTIAAYLERRNIIRSPRGLVYQARQYEAFSDDDLRGYIAQHAGDPVVRTYLRYFPIGEAEAKRLPKDHKLKSPVDWADETPFDVKGYRTHTAAPNPQHVQQSLRRMAELDPKKQGYLLDLIAAGLTAKATDREFGKQVRKGRWARQVLAASLAHKVPNIEYPTTGRKVFQGEDGVQEGMARLMSAIIAVAERSDEKRPGELWPWLEDKILHYSGTEG